VARAKQAVLIGAGHAHLYAAKRAHEFTRRGYELVVIAPGAFWYSGLATGMLGGTYPPAMDRIDIENVLGGRGRFIRDEVVELNAARRTLTLGQHGSIIFDALSVDLGSQAPPIAGAGPPDCYDVKPIRRLYELRCELERRFAADPDRHVRVAIAGGGITAFEIAANVAQLAGDRSGRADIAVYAGGTAPLEQLPRPAAAAVIRDLTDRGVAIRLGERVERIEDHRLVSSGGSFATFDLFVNATGLRPAPAVRSLGLPVDGDGALLVDEHLMSVSAAGVFGGGDCIAFRGRALPRIGVYAVRQAPVLHHNLLATLDGTALRRFRPQRRYLAIMTLGDGRGLAVRGSLWWHGRAAFWLKDRIDRRFLSEYRPRNSFLGQR
jgi:NADH dehydrogenase FAD-containing subunit